VKSGRFIGKNGAILAAVLLVLLILAYRVTRTAYCVERFAKRAAGKIAGSERGSSLTVAREAKFGNGNFF